MLLKAYVQGFFWKNRNNRIFRQKERSLQQLVDNISSTHFGGYKQNILPQLLIFIIAGLLPSSVLILSLARLLFRFLASIVVDFSCIVTVFYLALAQDTLRGRGVLLVLYISFCLLQIFFKGLIIHFFVYVNITNWKFFIFCSNKKTCLSI